MTDEPSPKLEFMIVNIPLAVFGRKSVSFNAADGKVLEIAIRALDPIQLYCARWSHEPEVIAGIPIIPGADVMPVRSAAVMKLESEFTRLSKPWPGAIMNIDV